jgi:hypothetical protein
VSGAGEPDRFARVCRRHPDVVAAWEAPDGVLALLFRQTLLPLPEERGRWYHETRRAARAVIADLRAAGLAGQVTVLQWRPVEDVAEVLTGWTRRYLGDVARLAQLRDIVATRLVGREADAPPRREPRPRDAAPAGLAVSPTLLDWYRDLSPCWLGAEPRVRRRLILKTHQWIVERVLAPIARGERPTVADLAPNGRLVWSLVRVVPAGELDVWKPWIRLTLADLERALAWPPARRTEAWVRWLFFIPYSIPVTGRRPAGVASPSADRQGGVA